VAEVKGSIPSRASNIMYKVVKVENYEELERTCNQWAEIGYILEFFQYRGSGIFVLIFKDSRINREK
jgi:hypothetical protein